MDNKEFEKILEDDEYVLRTYRPNSKRLAIWNILLLFWCMLPLILLGAFVIFLLNSDIDKEEFGIANITPIYFLLVLYLVVFLLGAFVIISNGLRIRYAVTNKRLILRKGGFGERFVCLDLSAIKTKDVKCGLLDKMVHPNTGRLIYSTGEALRYTIQNVNRNTNANNIGIMVFSYIENPFDVFKYINSVIEQAKFEEN